MLVPNLNHHFCHKESEDALPRALLHAFKAHLTSLKLEPVVKSAEGLSRPMMSLNGSNNQSNDDDDGHFLIDRGLVDVAIASANEAGSQLRASLNLHDHDKFMPKADRQLEAKTSVEILQLMAANWILTAR